MNVGKLSCPVCTYEEGMERQNVLLCVKCYEAKDGIGALW